GKNREDKGVEDQHILRAFGEISDAAPLMAGFEDEPEGVLDHVVLTLDQGLWDTILMTPPQRFLTCVKKR
ncbi:MAG: hypothetical protein AAGA95_14430, partial [Pseudomonadota bacterium]